MLHRSTGKEIVFNTLCVHACVCACVFCKTLQLFESICLHIEHCFENKSYIVFFGYRSYFRLELKFFVRLLDPGNLITNFYTNKFLVGQRCRTEVTINVVSNECSRPLNYVRITSSRYFRIISSSNGVYTLRVCRLPTYLTLRRYGFQPLRVYARQSSETVTMRCRGKIP